MERNDWTPAVLITATVSLVTAGLVWLLVPVGGRGGRPGEEHPRRAMQAEVTVWTGDLGQGLKGVLGPVWGDPQPDRDHDEILNGRLGLRGDRALAYFRLLIFNVSEELRAFELSDGVILMRDEKGGSPLPLRNLARVIEEEKLEIPGGLRFSLRSLGTLSTKVEIPAGRFAKLVVPFDRKARLDTAEAVITANGTSLKRRQIYAAVFRRLMEDPDERSVKDL